MQEIVLNGPGKNALGTPMMQSILDQLDAADGQPILLRGENGALSAGVDLKEVARLDADEMEAFLRLLDQVTRTLLHWPRPTVAVLDGHAIAGGCVIAMACDHRVAQANPKLRIGLTEVAVGVLFPPGVWAMLRHRLPPQSIDEIVLGGSLHSPSQALALGLLDKVSEDALASGRKTLSRLASYDASVYAETKALLREGVMDIEPRTEQAFLDAAVPVWTSPALRERLLAHLAKVSGKRA